MTTMIHTYVDLKALLTPSIYKNITQSSITISILKYTSEVMAKIYREGFSVVGSGKTICDGTECQPIVNIVFIHGLGGHPRETWETPAAHTQSDDGRRATKRHEICSIFGTKAKHREVVHDEANAHSHGKEPRGGQTIFWIEDFLREEVPSARILTYGYNADVIGGLFQANNKNRISQHGRDLKAKLERDLENNAPIIFVAHSLGGIIAKDALHLETIDANHMQMTKFSSRDDSGYRALSSVLNAFIER